MHTHNEPIIITKDLQRAFGDFLAVDRLNLEIYRGEVFGFLGHNGAGKTTTVRLLNGALTPTAGNARVMGLDPMAQGPQLRRRTGVLTENPSLEERLSGEENLRIFAELYDVPRERVPARVRELLARFELTEAASAPVGTYSKGMKQRLALARALLHDPELLFLDEPTSGLDPVAGRGVHELIQQLTASDAHTVFLCTHNLNEAQLLCDRVAVLEHGRLVAIGSPAELARDYGGGARVTLETTPGTLAGAQQALAQFAHIRVEQEGDNLLHLEGAAREDIPRLIRALTEAGVELYRVVPEAPTLEDVYFALHSEREKERSS